MPLTEQEKGIDSVPVFPSFLVVSLIFRYRFHASYHLRGMGDRVS